MYLSIKNCIRDRVRMNIVVIHVCQFLLILTNLYVIIGPKSLICIPSHSSLAAIFRSVFYNRTASEPVVMVTARAANYRYARNKPSRVLSL